MINAVVVLNVERNRINAVAEALAGLAHVSEVYSVSGRYDLVAMVRVSEVDDLADVVTRQMARIEGITQSETMLAFQSYSRHDLEALFAIGSDGP